MPVSAGGQAGKLQHHSRLGRKIFCSDGAFTPQPAQGSELRAQKEYATQIIDKLVKMEEEYFALRRKRCGGFEETGEYGKEPGFALSKKILTDAEIEICKNAENPDMALWSLWACKETSV